METGNFLTAVSTWIILLISTALFVLYKYGTSTFHYFSDQGIPGPKPVPFIGNMWGIWKKNFLQHDADLVARFGKVFGYFEGSQPNLFVSDPELIHRILIKDFDHFTNRRDYQVRRKFFRKMIFHIRDEEWKEVRSSISPVFTADKMKKMSLFIKESADQMTDRLSAVAQDKGQFTGKDVFSTFTMEVIARCVFAMKVDGLGDEDDLFMRNARLAFNAPANKSPLILLPFVFPKLTSIFGDELLAPKEFRYFMDLLERVIEDRSQVDQKYNDFVEFATESIGQSTKVVDGSAVATWTRAEVEEIVIAQVHIDCKW